jgi:hypothetical protein
MPYSCTVPPLNRMAHIGCVPCYHSSTTQLTNYPTLHPMLHLAQPGGVLRQMHVRYTARCKLALLTMAISPGQRGHLSLQVRGTCSGVCFAPDEVGGALQPQQ